MSKNCENCNKKMSSIVYVPKYKIGNLEYDLCEKCSKTIQHMVNKIKYSEDLEQLEANKNEVFEEMNKVDINHIIKHSIEHQLLTETKEKIENRIKEQEKIENERRIEQERKYREQELRQQLLEDYQKRYAEFMITTGYDFEGYKIIKYHGIASGELVLGTGFLSEFGSALSDVLGMPSFLFSDKMNRIKNGAMNRLIKDALDKGGNALIGVDFDYITLDHNMLGVSANGTVVTIEKK